MHSLSTVLALAASATTALADPSILSDLAAANKRFTLHQQEVQRTSPWRGPQSIRRAYLKYGVVPPAEIETAARLAESRNVATPGSNAVQGVNRAAADSPDDGQTSTETSSVRSDIEFVLRVQVGNHNLSMNLDTGSSDLWVMSSLQPQSQRYTRPQGRVYDPIGSKAQELQGYSWTVQYGDKSGATGKVYLDRVTIGDLTVEKQAVEAATQVAATFTRDNYNDGILGLAFSKLNAIRPKSQKTWFDNIRPKLEAPLFTSSLKRRSPGSYDFGYIDKAKYKGEISYVPVDNRRGFWAFSPTSFEAGKLKVEGKLTAIADTGTSLWYLPQEHCKAYWSQVQGASFNMMQQGYTFPCASKLPDAVVVVGNTRITVPGINMNYQQVSQTTCFGGMQPDTGMPFSIFGATFLKGQFVVYESPNEGSARLGFAAAAEGGSTATTTPLNSVSQLPPGVSGGEGLGGLGSFGGLGGLGSGGLGSGSLGGAPGGSSGSGGLGSLGSALGGLGGMTSAGPGVTAMELPEGLGALLKQLGLTGKTIQLPGGSSITITEQ